MDCHHEIACRQRLQGRQRRASVPVGVTEQLTHARVGGGEKAVLLAASQEQEVRYVRLSSFCGAFLSDTCVLFEPLTFIPHSQCTDVHTSVPLQLSFEWKLPERVGCS